MNKTHYRLVFNKLRGMLMAASGVAAAGNSANLVLNGGSASLLNSTNHGINVGAASTTISGGTHSSVWTLADGNLDGAGPGSNPGGATLTVSGTSGTAKTLFNATTNDDSSLSAVTIGDANTSTNIIQGATNTITGTTNSIVGTTNINTTTLAGTLTTVGNVINAVTDKALQVNGGISSTGNAAIATANGTTNTFGSGTGANNTIGGGSSSVNTIGNAYTSTNIMQGNTNTISSAGGVNQLQTNATGAANGTTLSGSGATNGVVISGSNQATPAAQSQITLNSSRASIATPTAGGGSVVINNNTSTVLSGGTAAGGTTMTLNSNGASFANNGTGAPVRVGGIADGVAPNDAVNKRQLDLLDDKLGGVADKAYAGVASALAMSALPQIRPGFNYSVGMAVGNYANQSAVAIGAKANVGENWQLNASAGVSQGNNAVAVGAGFSW